MLTHFLSKNLSVADSEEDRQGLRNVIPANRLVAQSQAAEREPDHLVQQFFAIHAVINYWLGWQVIHGYHSREVMCKPNSVLSADRAFHHVARLLSRHETGPDIIETAGKPVLVQNARKFAIFQATV